MIVKLILMEASKPVQEYEIKGSCTIGRNEGNDIVISDSTVSPSHARIEMRGDKIILHDNNSINGTWVNDERIEEKALSDGDEIRVGGVILKFYHQEKDEVPVVTKVTPAQTPPRQKTMERGKNLVLAIAVGVLAVIATMVLFSPKKSSVPPVPPVEKEKMDKTVSLSQLAPVISSKSLMAKELIEEANSEINLANRLYSERNISRENLYLSITKWRSALEKLDAIVPKPQLYEETVSKLKIAEEEIDQMINTENDVAYKCWQVNDYQGVLEHLYNVLELIPDPNDPRNKRAKERILKYEKMLQGG